MIVKLTFFAITSLVVCIILVEFVLVPEWQDRIAQKIKRNKDK